MDHLRLMFRHFISVLFLLLLIASPVCSARVAGGVGVQVVPVSTGELTVLHVIDGLPAARAGLKPGDLITEVDGRTLRGTDFEEVTRSYLWGEVGSSITMVWLRPGTAGSMRAELTRVAINENMNVKPIPGVKIATP